MLMREKGPQPADARKEIWKVFSHEGDHEQRYVSRTETSRNNVWKAKLISFKLFEHGNRRRLQFPP